MATLLETYKNRLAVAESVFSKSNNGKKMDNNRKLILATVLNNTNRYMTEQMDSSMATQRSDIGMWKRFSLNLTTVAIPY